MKYHSVLLLKAELLGNLISRLSKKDGTIILLRIMYLLLAKENAHKSKFIYDFCAILAKESQLIDLYLNCRDKLPKVISVEFDLFDYYLNKIRSFCPEGAWSASKAEKKKNALGAVDCNNPYRLQLA